MLQKNEKQTSQAQYLFLFETDKMAGENSLLFWVGTTRRNGKLTHLTEQLSFVKMKYRHQRGHCCGTMQSV